MYFDDIQKNVISKITFNAYFSFLAYFSYFLRSTISFHHHFFFRKKEISAEYKELLFYYQISLYKSETLFDTNEKIDVRVKWKV